MALASATATVSSFALRLSSSSPSPSSFRVSFNSVKFPFSNKLNWSATISTPILHQNLSLVTTIPPRSLTIVSAKGYKIKTHKASAKRFRVTGAGKIVRRRAGKQHLLAKKSNKRKLRLSKMIQVDRSDYDNVIRALPHMKVNRKAT